MKNNLKCNIKKTYFLPLTEFGLMSAPLNTCVGSLRVLRLPPTVQKHGRWEDSKLSLGVSVNVCVVVCLVCLYVAL